jgi:hypothetical protein
MTPAPSRQRVDEPNTVSGAPWTRTTLPSLQAQEPTLKAAELPPGFELDDHGDHDRIGAETGRTKPGVGTGEALIRGAVDQPIVGPIIGKADAALLALRASLHPEDPNISHADTFSQRMAENEAIQKARTAAAYQEHPVAANVANIGAGIALPAGIIKAGPIGARLLGMVGGGLTRQIPAMAASGAGIGALDAALRGNDPVRGAEFGGAFGAVAPVIGRGIGAAAGGLANRAINAMPGLGTAGIKQAAQNGFQSLDRDVRFNPNTIDTALDDIQKEMGTRGFDPGYQKPVFDILDNIRPKPSGLPGVGPVPTGFGDIINARQALNDLTRGIPTKDTTAAHAARDLVDEMMDKFTTKIGLKDVISGDATAALRGLNTANKNWASYKTADMLEQAMERAELRASSTGSGRSNYANQLRQQFRPILDKIIAGKLRVPADVEAGIRGVVSGSAYGTRWLSKLAPTGIVSGGIEAGISHMMGGGIPGAIAAAGIGHAAKVAQDRLVLGRVMRAIQAAQRQAPAEQAYRAALPPPQTARVLQRVARYAPITSGVRVPLLTSYANNQQP